MIIYNTLTKRKERFEPITPGVVRMFVCGPTVYALSHVGHAKTYTQFDLIARYLRHRGYRVTYAQNITDIDNKIIRRAQETSTDPRALAARYEELYLEDMAALRNTSIDVYARAHDYIGAIVAQVQELIRCGHAYRLDDGWYFDLGTFPEYGKLSGRTDVRPEDSVSRIDEHTGKRNPGDFALWKARKEGEPYWDCPLGPGRPGWHIEDTAITEALFGPQYDLHGGAVDLIFPHHEAEVAQLEAASGRSPLARYWMHTGLLRVGGEKMSKSSGNFLTVREALAITDFRTLRYAFVSQHYRSSMELSDDTLHQARAARRRIENFAHTIRATDSPESTALVDQTRTAFFARMDDDFDTPGALAVLFQYIREQNRSTTPAGPASAALLNEINALFDAFVLDKQADEDQEIAAAVERRRRLRSGRNFAEADAVRADLAERGIALEDTPDGTRWWRSHG
ncbi:MULTISPECIES: cysteine--tRNA ligase [Streptomyces]|uniref:Cysteine--tRNA ligase n=1 Tax=Streptomyces dengpaensis TaxID=2049881 RepID=A0ABN5HUE0_9ACTN|nr:MULTISPECIES: cysteine--tRNA ligase [Streptomyces]AVH54745.1 cysteine--tRNA ligase [Streptomyces dengpaensis]PIB03845.1 cysteine--tRNA ligase [Streptomyces sp. HG99]